MGMDKDRLTPFEYFALQFLLDRRPLFRWEAEAMTPDLMESLRRRELVQRDEDQWRLTELGLLSLQLRPVTVLGRVPRDPRAPKHVVLRLTTRKHSRPR